jgi:valine--pyruvate aminotransferase
MWLWFPNLSITSEQLYNNLKADDVFIVPGQDFFIGIDDDWDHKHQCIRINYAKDEVVLKKGLEVIYNHVKSSQK